MKPDTLQEPYKACSLPNMQLHMYLSAFPGLRASSTRDNDASIKLCDYFWGLEISPGSAFPWQE